MPKRSAIDRLPREDRDWLDRQIVERGFSDYVGLERLLLERGYTIGKSTLHRRGQKLERRLEAIKASTEAAILIADAAPDAEDARSEAVLALVQSDLFEAMLALQEAEQADPEDRIKLLTHAARAISDVSRASVGQKKHAADVRKKAEAAAKDARQTVTSAGLSDEVADQIASKILGIAS